MSIFHKHPRYRLIVLCLSEICILFLCFLWMRQGIRRLTPVEISVTDWTCQHSVYHDGAFSVEGDLLDSGEETVFLYGPGLPLKKGTYAANIRYEAEKDQYCEASGANVDTEIQPFHTLQRRRCVQSKGYQYQSNRDPVQKDRCKPVFHPSPSESCVFIQEMSKTGTKIDPADTGHQLRSLNPAVFQTCRQ